MRELFARLRLHFEPTTFEKGPALSLHGARHVAQADPVLLESILRNLVSNAMRYTDDGGVLVNCRPRPTQEGGKLLMQVWDSGIGVGISEASLPHIFDAFYEVQSQRPLAAQQRKGLGPGLAIVARLSQLKDAPISVQSRVGRGTVFAFEVPVGSAPRALEPAAEKARSPLGLTLQGRLMLVVQDEAAVREGLVVLLKARGASVIALDTVAAVQDWLYTQPAEAPELLIVDYRLPQATTGLVRWPRCELMGRSAGCRPSTSPAAPLAATRARPPSMTSTCSSSRCCRTSCPR